MIRTTLVVMEEPVAGPCSTIYVHVQRATLEETVKVSKEGNETPCYS